MTVKEKVANFIRTTKYATIAEWREFQSECPQLRIKSVGSKGDVLINFEGKGVWLSPRDWYYNYVAAIQHRLEQEIRRARNILPPEVMTRLIGDDALKGNDSTQTKNDLVASILNYYLGGNNISNVNELIQMIELCFKVSLKEEIKTELHSKDPRINH